MSTPENPNPGDAAPEAEQAAFAATTLAGDGPRPAHTPRAMVLQRGAAVGRYVVLEKLGAGGMGIVYAAFDPELDRRIALKLLHPRTFAKRPDTAKARLLREAQALAKLSHPSVITVHDVGTYEDQVFVAMEFVDGVDLATWLVEQDRTREEILATYLDAGRGLAAAHEAGIVHRDFKPENVLVGRDGRVRVLDFGLATTEDDLDTTAEPYGPEGPGDDDDGDGDPSASRSAARSRSKLKTQLKVVDLPERSTQLSTRLTQVGAIMGTPAYMAPEQHQGQRTDPRSDQFSFCVALYEALYGQRPYAGRTRAQLLVRMLDGTIREPSRDGPAVPGWIRKILVRGLATQPVERWPDMASLLAALSPKPKTNRRGLALGAAGVIVAGAAVAVTWPDNNNAEAPCQGAERKLAGVWDDEIRVAVRQAFVATQRPYATDALTTTERFLDDYTRVWVAKHTEACEATAVHKEQSQELLDRQMICLGRRLKDVRALTRLLSEADAQMVTRAVTATTNLPRVDPCMDPELVMSGAAPLTGARAEQAAAVDDLMARARQLDAFGRYDEAVTTAIESREAALGVDDPERRAESTAMLGRVELHHGDAKTAERTLLEAVWLADNASADLIRAKAWTDLVWAIGYDQARTDEVDALRQHAEASMHRAGGDALLSAMLHENLGGIARSRNGDPETALREHEQALQIRREQLGADAPQVAVSLTNLAQARADVGQYEAAERNLEEAMTIFEQKFGKTHPRVASVLHTRGFLAFRRGAHERAATLMRDAIRVREAALAPDHPDLAKVVGDLGWVLLQTEDHANALPQFLRASKLRQARLGKNHINIANSMTGAGQALAGLGRTDDAAATLRDALAMHDALGTRGELRAETETALARVLAGTDPARARELALSARAAYSSIGKPDQARALDDLLTSLSAP